MECSICENKINMGDVYKIICLDCLEVNSDNFTYLKTELKKYKWLYHIVCLAIHDISELPLDEIKKDFEHLWDLKSERERNKKNVN